MKQAGELEWKNLTERQRQLRLAELKRKERQLRREGIKPSLLLFCFGRSHVCCNTPSIVNIWQRHFRTAS